MSRHITTHVTNPANDKLAIVVTDEPGSGGANHSYRIRGFNTTNNPSKLGMEKPEQDVQILFQNGPINEVGVNGLTHEALLAILIDRLEGFQSGPYASEYNQNALEDVRSALDWLQRRTKERMARGVEGTHQL